MSRQSQNFQALLKINTSSHLLLNFFSGHHSVSCGLSPFHIFFSGSFIIIFSLLNIIHFFCPPFSGSFAFTYPGRKCFRPLRNLSLVTKGFILFQLGWLLSLQDDVFPKRRLSFDFPSWRSVSYARHKTSLRQRNCFIHLYNSAPSQSLARCFQDGDHLVPPDAIEQKSQIAVLGLDDTSRHVLFGP